MATNTIDAGLLAKMFLAGAKNLEVKKEWINELNVFPVPDGDTGTNMTLTIMSAVKEVNSLTEVNMYNLSKAISSRFFAPARNIFASKPASIVFVATFFISSYYHQSMTRTPSTRMLIFSISIPVNSSTLYFTLLIRLSVTAEILTP